MNLQVPDGIVTMIKTARLILRTMRPTDLEDLLHVFANPKVRTPFVIAPFDRQRMERWVLRNMDHQRQYGYGLYSVMLKTNGLLIGDCGLEQTDLNGMPTAELSYNFRRDYWTQSIAMEAATSVQNCAFQVLHLPRLVSLIRVGNIASQRVVEKIGMKYVSKFTRHGHRYWLYTIAPDIAKLDLKNIHLTEAKLSVEKR